MHLVTIYLSLFFLKIYFETCLLFWCLKTVRQIFSTWVLSDGLVLLRQESLALKYIIASMISQHCLDLHYKNYPVYSQSEDTMLSPRLRNKIFIFCHLNTYYECGQQFFFQHQRLLIHHIFFQQLWSQYWLCYSCL